MVFFKRAESSVLLHYNADKSNDIVLNETVSICFRHDILISGPYHIPNGMRTYLVSTIIITTTHPLIPGTIYQGPSFMLWLISTFQ